MQVKLTEFLQFKNLHTDVKQQGECVTIFWYDNPPEPKEPLTLDKSYYSNKYTVQINVKAQRKIQACALVYRPSANSYKVAYARCSAKGVCELITCKNYDEIIEYLKKQSKLVKQ